MSTEAERAAFEAFFPAASANWLPRSNCYSGPYYELWLGWQARGESDAGATARARPDPLQVFAQEVAIGAYRPSELYDAARLALSRAAALSVQEQPHSPLESEHG